MSLECPRCRLISPDETCWCECGYRLKPHKTETVGVEIDGRPLPFSEQSVLEAYAKWLLTFLTCEAVHIRHPTKNAVEDMQRISRENWRIRDEYARGVRGFSIRNIIADRKIVKSLRRAEERGVALLRKSALDLALLDDRAKMVLRSYGEWLSSKTKARRDLWEITEKALYASAEAPYYNPANGAGTEGDNQSLDRTALNELLMEAAKMGNAPLVAAAIAKGADVNILDPQTGMTPLIYASGRGFTDVVEMLLEGGADLRVVAGPGVTARGAAIMGRHWEVRKLLDIADLSKGKYLVADYTAKGGLCLLAVVLGYIILRACSA